MIDHRHALTLAATAVDFPLDVADRDVLEAHVRQCAACRAELAAYQQDAARLAGLPPIAPPAWVRGVIGRPHRPHRFVLLAAAAMLLIASAGIALGVGSVLRDARIPDVSPFVSPVTSPVATPLPSGSPEQALSELQVACDGTRTNIPTPLVRTQADGIHIHFANTSGRTLDFGIEDASGTALLGSSIPGVGGSYVYTFGPGSYQLTCGTSATAFAVVDPDRFYASPELTCAGDRTQSTVDYANAARGPHGSLVDIARTQLRGLEPTDVVERAGYPQAATDQLVRVVRNGDVVAALAYADDGHGGWLITRISTCSGSNITVVSPKG